MGHMCAQAINYLVRLRSWNAGQCVSIQAPSGGLVAVLA